MHSLLSLCVIESLQDIFVGIMALTDYPVPGDVYAWTVVFILPLNSALNPILYTFSSIIGRKVIAHQNRILLLGLSN